MSTYLRQLEDLITGIQDKLRQFLPALTQPLANELEQCIIELDAAPELARKLSQGFTGDNFGRRPK